LTSTLCAIFYYLFLIAFFVDNPFWNVFYLWGIASIINMVYASISGADSAFNWTVGTIAVYPLFILLFPEVSWFGFLN